MPYLVRLRLSQQHGDTSDSETLAYSTMYWGEGAVRAILEATLQMLQDAQLVGETPSRVTFDMDWVPWKKKPNKEEREFRYDLLCKEILEKCRSIVHVAFAEKAVTHEPK